MNRRWFGRLLILACTLTLCAPAIGDYPRLRRGLRYRELPPGFVPRELPPAMTARDLPQATLPSDLDAWRQKRTRDFFNPTSPFFGDPYYDPLKTSPMSPFRSPQYHPWGTSPFRGDPYYDPYAPRRDRLDFYNRRR